MGRIVVTVFYDPKAADSSDMVETLSALAPQLGVGVTYVDITKDKELMKKYDGIAPIATHAGQIIFSGGFNEQMMRSRVKRFKRK